MTGPGGRDVREIVRDEPLMRTQVLRVLAQRSMTIPEIAAALDRPSHEVMLWVMGMRKYGSVTELPGVTADGHYRYRASQGRAS
jgi:hypothetical protein